MTPTCWVLLTSLPANAFEDAWQVVEDYENRWLVEEYHKVMKTGCSLELHALRTADRLEPLIGLISVIGVRLFRLKLIGRNQPDAKAATHIPSDWLKCLKLARPKTKLSGMAVYEFFRELAKMGGFLGRKGDGEPGWQTIWRGFQKLQSIIDAKKLIDAQRSLTPKIAGKVKGDAPGYGEEKAFGQSDSHRPAWTSSFSPKP